MGVVKMTDKITIVYSISKDFIEARTGMLLTDEEYKKVCEILPDILRKHCDFSGALYLAARDCHDK
ncbi:TPA_asm: hypothetical protein vir520_00010 [Caudoviricetes sp. vir520]|nr:TPA_asm: hypothetical protein vir520_00010 [Caudoviricetes sp. vir520]